MIRRWVIRAMPGNSFGELFRVTTAGVSHGPGYLVIIDGCPPGLPLSVDDLLPDLRRRRRAIEIVTQRKEEDVPEIWSGVFEGKTDGTSIGILFRNTDQRSQDYGDIKDKYRPGHADFTFDAKYGFRDYRGGGRSSARETVCRVAAGAIAKKLLAQQGIRVLGYVKQIGSVIADVPDPTQVTLEQVEATPVRCPDPAAAERMIALIEEVRKDQDSIGGVCELVAIGRAAGPGRAGLRQAEGRPGQGAAVAAGGDGVRVRGRLSPWPRPAAAPTTTRSFRKAEGGIGTETQPARRHARRHQQRRADRLPGGGQADQQPAAAATDRDPQRRADRDRHARPARSVSVAALRADGRGDGGAGAGRSLAALAGPVRVRSICQNVTEKPPDPSHFRLSDYPGIFLIAILATH